MQRKPSDYVLDLNEIVVEEEEDGKKLKGNFSVFQHFLADT